MKINSQNSQVFLIVGSPNLQESWESIVSYYVASAHADAVTSFKQLTHELLKSEFPPSEEEIKHAISKIQSDCFTYYKELLFQIENLYKQGIPHLKVIHPFLFLMEGGDG